MIRSAPYGTSTLLARYVGAAFLTACLSAGLSVTYAQEAPVAELQGAYEPQSADELGGERRAEISTLALADIDEVDDRDEAPQEVILSFRYSDVITADVSARYVGTDIYVPVGGLFSLLGISWELDHAASTISGFFLEEDRRYRLDFASGEARLGDVRRPLAPGDFLVLEHDVFVRPRVIEDVFGVHVAVDLAALAVYVKSDRILPVEARSRRARERPMTMDPYAAFRHAPLAFNRDRKLIGGGVADYNLSLHRSADQTRLSVQSALGAELLGGDVSWQGRAGVGRGPFLSHDYVRWRYVLDEGALRQVRLGTLNSDGLRPERYRGFHITNHPARPERLFGEYRLTGHVDPDWELELYMDDRLIDVTRAPASGFYQFEVPLTYGTSRFHVRAYGPAGEIRDARQRIRIPFTMIAPGNLRYNVYAGASREQSGYIGQGDVGYGISKNLTTRLGVDYVGRTGEKRPLVYGSATSRLLRHFLASVDASNRGVQRLSLNGLFPSQATIEVHYSRSDLSTRSQIAGGRSRLSASGFLPFHVRRYPLSVRLSAARLRYGSEDQYRIRSHVQGAFNGLQYYVTAETDISGAHRSARIVPALSYVWSSPPAPLAYFRGMMVSARVRYDAVAGRMDGIELNAAHSVTRTTRVQLFTNLGMGHRRTSVGFRLSTALPYARSVTDTRIQQSSATVMQTFRGSMAVDRQNGRLLVSDRPAVGRSAAALRLFVDRNGNGFLDGDEHVLEHNAIQLDRGSALSSGHSGGVTHVGDLLPYERYTARIDESAISNPLWVPHQSAFSFIADPNSVKAIDVPLYAAGVVEGRVIDRQTGTSYEVGGILVRIVDLGDGSERVLQTFSDGTFYEMGFRPGAYEAYLDRSQLGARNLTVASPVQRFVVRTTADGDYVDDLRFVVAERRREEPADPLFVDPVPVETLPAATTVATIRDRPDSAPDVPRGIPVASAPTNDVLPAAGALDLERQTLERTPPSARPVFAAADRITLPRDVFVPGVLLEINDSFPDAMAPGASVDVEADQVSGTAMDPASTMAMDGESDTARGHVAAALDAIALEELGRSAVKDAVVLEEVGSTAVKDAATFEAAAAIDSHARARRGAMPSASTRPASPASRDPVSPVLIWLTFAAVFAVGVHLSRMEPPK